MTRSSTRQSIYVSGLIGMVLKKSLACRLVKQNPLRFEWESLARGVEDILITATDNLSGFTDTIKSVFPEFTTHIAYIRYATLAVMWYGKRRRNL